MNRRKVKKWLIIIGVIYLLGGIALYFLQDAIMFHPVSLKRDHDYKFKEPHQDISIPISETDNLNMIRFYSTDTITRGVVLYFHGNKKNISRYAEYMHFFTDKGYQVIIIDYPGFGKSTGKFTEKTLYEWSEQVYKFARSEFAADSIIIYGKSMGTGIATHLAMRQTCSQLILETPYYDLPSVISHYLPIYPVGKMLHYQFPLYRYLPAVKARVTIFHGTDDGVITYGNAKRLMPLLKPSDQFITIKGGSHNDLFKFRDMTTKLDELLSSK